MTFGFASGLSSRIASFLRIPAEILCEISPEIFLEDPYEIRLEILQDFRMKSSQNCLRVMFRITYGDYPKVSSGSSWVQSGNPEEVISKNRNLWGVPFGNSFGKEFLEALQIKIL